MPRTRCSRASSSTLGSAPRLVSRGLCVSGALARGGGALARGGGALARGGGALARGGGTLARGFGGFRGFRGFLGRADGGLGVSAVRLGLGPALGRAVLGRAVLGRGVLGRAVLGRGVLGRAVLGRGVLGRAVLGRGVLGGLGRPGLGPGLALLGPSVFLGFLAGLALLGGGREALLLVRAGLGRPEGPLGPGFPGELLPVPGDLEQDADRVGGLR